MNEYEQQQGHEAGHVFSSASGKPRSRLTKEKRQSRRKLRRAYLKVVGGFAGYLKG